MLASLVARPRLVLAAIALLTLVGGLGATRLERRLDPRGILPPSEGAGASADARVVVLMRASGDGIRTDAALDHLHAIARALEAAGAKVDGLTRTPLPTSRRGARGLAALDAELSADEPRGEAVRALVTGWPEHFPGGLAGLGERVGELELAPLVASDTPTTEEREVLRGWIDGPSLRGGLVGASGRSLMLVVDDIDFDAIERVVVALPPPPGVEVDLSGRGALEATIEREVGASPWFVFALAALGNLLVLFVGFRHATSVMAPLAAGGVSVALVMGALGWLGVPLTLLTVLLPPLLLTIAVGDGVHLASRFAEERAHYPPREAAVRAARHTAGPCFATSLTTAMGFGSFALADSPALRELALVAAAGVFVAFGVALLLVPALLSLDRRAPPLPPRRLALPARFALARPGAALALAGACAALGTLGAGGLRVETRLLDPFATDHPARQAARWLEREHGGLLRLVVEAPHDPATPTGFAALGALESALREAPGVVSVSGPRSLMTTIAATLTPRPAALLADPEVAPALASLAAESPTYRALVERGARIELGLRDLPAHEVEALAAALEARHGVRVGGTSRQSARALDAIGRDLARGFALALALVMLVIALTTRSLRAALASLPPNLLPLVMVAGWMGARGIPLDAGTAMVFAITLGLVVDGSLHFLARYREARAAHDPGAAAEEATRGAGRGVVLGGLTLLAGFGALLASPFGPMATFGELSVVALSSGVLAELVVMPTMLARVVR
ncbi:MAG: MMPL family transporter [Myxococcales bacterium]|nr:MMPL family transporter [Myxococcales bacterium]